MVGTHFQSNFPNTGHGLNSEHIFSRLLPFDFSRLFHFRLSKQRFTTWRRGHVGNPETAWTVWSTLSAARCTSQMSVRSSAPSKETPKMLKPPKKSNVTRLFNCNFSILLKESIGSYWSVSSFLCSSLVPKENSRFGQMSSSGHKVRPRLRSGPPCK